MKIQFWCQSKSLGSTKFRALQLVEVINRLYPNYAGASVGDEIAESRRSIHDALIIPILSVGDSIESYLTDSIITELKSRNNFIYPDILDSFCWSDYNPFFNTSVAELFSRVDGVIIYNNFTRRQISSSFPHLNLHIIPHQWDVKYQFISHFDRKSIRADGGMLYVGTRGGLQVNLEKLDGLCQIDFNYHETDIQLEFPIHISFRRESSADYFYKPAAKLATAVGTKSLFLTSKDHSVLEILGESWPLYCESEDQIIERYNEISRFPERYWDAYQYQITTVREYLSPSKIAGRFVSLLLRIFAQEAHKSFPNEDEAANDRRNV